MALAEVSSSSTSGACKKKETLARVKAISQSSNAVRFKNVVFW
jgi:hypothetical protein